MSTSNIFIAEIPEFIHAVRRSMTGSENRDRKIPPNNFATVEIDESVDSESIRQSQSERESIGFTAVTRTKLLLDSTVSLPKRESSLELFSTKIARLTLALEELQRQLDERQAATEAETAAAAEATKKEKEALLRQLDELQRQLNQRQAATEAEAAAEAKAKTKTEAEAKAAADVATAATATALNAAKAAAAPPPYVCCVCCVCARCSSASVSMDAAIRRRRVYPLPLVCSSVPQCPPSPPTEPAAV
jgi:Tfp pilus assembly protein FimV